jgi:hypothetical protein
MYHYFTTYCNNVVKVDQDPNKGEEQVHVYFVSDDGTVKVVSTHEIMLTKSVCFWIVEQRMFNCWLLPTNAS